MSHTSGYRTLRGRVVRRVRHAEQVLDLDLGADEICQQVGRLLGGLVVGGRDLPNTGDEIDVHRFAAQKRIHRRPVHASQVLEFVGPNAAPPLLHGDQGGPRDAKVGGGVGQRQAGCFTRPTQAGADSHGIDIA